MILMIDNYDSFTYNLVQGFRELGAEMDVVRNDAIDMEGLRARASSALILSPGPGNPDSAGITLAAIGEFAGKVPIFGVCESGYPCSRSASERRRKPCRWGSG